MTRPVYKIQTYTVDLLDHTITDDVESVYFKDVITDGVGQFRFVVPTKKNGGYFYDDIALQDKVKIFLGYDSVGATPDFVGKVSRISAPLSVDSGYVRFISGLGLGEILLRRFKTNNFYDGVGASTIVTELADDLGLGTSEIVGDATAETHEVRTKRYIDLLKEVSDYWFNAGTQVKKDFKVDVDNNLLWKARPLRTSGVETFIVGENILNYNVTRSLNSVKNNITVYGQAEAPYPRDKDEWTEDAAWDAYWTASVGSVLRTDGAGPLADPQVGSYEIMGDAGAGSQVTFKFNNPHITIRDINTLYFWYWASSVPPDQGQLRIHAPDSSNYFYTDLTLDGVWHFSEWPLGPKQEYDVATNPNGIWNKQGSPNWWNMEYIEFDCTWGGANQEIYIDGMYFYPERWTGTASDATSQTNYGQRDAEFTYNKLHSDDEAEKRAQTLLYQLKDSIVQIQLTTPGNTNVLVGDRLSMNIPAEGISASDFDVLTVEQFLSADGFLTKALMVNTANIRQPIESDASKLLSNLNRTVARLSEDMKLMK